MEPKPPAGRAAGIARRILRLACLAVAGFVLVFVVLITGCQRRMYFMPRPYQLGELRMLVPKTEVIEYTTGAGVQKAFYVKPAESPERPPDRVWMVFVGNASLALDWTDMVAQAPDRRAGFLLFDYPGYGVNQGHPRRATIAEASKAAVDALAGHLGLTRAQLCDRLSLIGHSMGTGASLDLAVRLDPPPRQIVLLASYTSLYDMARRTVGWPICCLLLDRFDNEARLNELAARNPRPQVMIVHGDNDRVIPVDMGRKLAAEHPGWIEYHEIHHAGHEVIDQALPFWYALMSAPTPAVAAPRIH